MPIPDYQTLMRPVLAAFAEGATNVRDVLPVLIEKFDLTDEEVAERIPSGAERSWQIAPTGRDHTWRRQVFFRPLDAITMRSLISVGRPFATILPVSTTRS